LTSDIFSIGKGAFRNCSALTSFTLPYSTTEIPEDMLNGCTSLKEFEFDSYTVTSIGEEAFANCAALRRINSLDDGTFIFSNEITFMGKGSLNGCVQLKYLVLPFVGESRNAKENAAMFGYIFGTTSYTGAKETVQDWNGDNWNEVTYYLPPLLKSVEISDATTIADYAFQNCATITDLYINEEIQETVSDNTFVGCVPPIYLSSYSFSTASSSVPSYGFSTDSSYVPVKIY
jgi:hypothetical protein